MPPKRKIKNEREYYEKMVKPFLEEHGFNVHKVTEKFKSGRPDILALKNGITYYIEIKKQGNWLTKLQALTLRKLANCLAPVYIFQYDRTYDFHNIYEVTEKGRIRAIFENVFIEVSNRRRIII